MAITLPPNLQNYEEYLAAHKRETTNWSKVVPTLDERLDYLNIQIGELVAIQRQLVIPKRPPSIRTIPHYNVRVYPLDSARTNEEIQISGDHIAAWTNGTLIGCTIKPDAPSEDAIPLDKFNPIAYPTRFARFYLTTTAQIAKTLYLFIGRDAGTETYPETTTSAERQTFYIVRSDKDLHFTGALAQYAKEDENLTGLITNKIGINSISIQSDQRLKFKLLFWSKDIFDDTDIDLDKYVGDVDLDLTVYGYQIDGSNQWYMSTTGILLDYIDEDETNELHVSLMNMGGTGKTAGSSGEVVLEFTYSPRT